MTAPVEAPARYVALSKGGLIRVGALAGTNTIHGAIPDGWTGSSCMACFAAVDAPQHLFHPVRVRVG